MLRGQIATLDPGVFAVVMATGIVSSGVADLGFGHPATLLLAAATGLFLVLGGLLTWRLFRFGTQALADARNPDKAFGYFTAIAGANVVGLGLADHHGITAVVLTIVSAAVWLLLVYALSAYLLVGRRTRSMLSHVNGGWLLSVVATQSLAASVATLARFYPHSTSWLGPVAVALWGLGVGLYLVLVVLVTLRLLDIPVSPEALDPTYWILMGATGSTVLAGADILMMPKDLPVLVVSHEVVAGGSVLMWAVGTWWVPLLLALGVWRYLVGHQPLRYEPGLWSIVFPLGMYAVSGTAFGHVSGLGFMIDAARAEIWLGIAAWCVVAGLQLHSLVTTSEESSA